MMNNENMKKGKFYMQMNSLKQNPEDPSLLDALYIIHDFEESWNGQVITEEVSSENMKFLINKPIVCKYIPKGENNGVDSLTDHEQFIDQDRNTGEDFISTDTISIGVITDVYIDDFTDENGVTKRVLYGKAVLWFDKNRNICLLLDEWMTKDIVVPASVEYMYHNYNMIDGVEHIQSPLIYLAHALLNAEDRENYPQIYPAYDSARLVNLNMQDQWNKAVAQSITVEGGDGRQKTSERIKTKNKVGEDGITMEVFKKVCELSIGDVRGNIYDALSKVMTAEEYNSMWISNYDIYDDYFIYELWENDEYNYFKIDYSKDNDVISVNLESKTKVERVVKWEEMQAQLDIQSQSIEDYKVEISNKDESILNLTEEKEGLVTKFDEATETLVSLNGKLEKLKEIETQYNAEKFESALNSRKDEFEKKFKSLNAIEEFNSEDVQSLLADSIENDESLTALNSMLVELIPEQKEEEKKVDKNTVKDFNTKQVKDLIPKDNSFESRYLQ